MGLIGLGASKPMQKQRVTLEDWRVFTSNCVMRVVHEKYPAAMLVHSSIETGALDASVYENIPIVAHPAIAICETIVQMDPTHSMPYLMRIPIGVVALEIPTWSDAEREQAIRRAVVSTMEIWETAVAKAEAAAAADIKQRAN